jgi:superfamily II DNA/RNA helicase
VQIVPTENLPGFRELGLPRGLGNALARAGIEAPFPIQAATIPDVLAGRDLLGRAATGSGKTLAFGLPLIARLEGTASAPRRPRGLVLVPTRELAMQVTDAIAPLAAARGVSVRLVAGGLPIQKQIQSLEKGVDVLVATPGRLVDLIERRSCDLREVEVTVLDEADHMADLGFLPVVRQLLDQTPSRGQRLLFSATLDGDVATLVDSYLTDPAVHALSTSGASIDTMSHHLFRVDFEAKFDLIASIAAREGRTICFVRTKHGAERMARNLGRVGISAGALHGGRTQSQRNRALEAFRDGSVPVLVATDVAARGIHVDDVSLVLHIDPPQDGKDYLHRSGRTARAGESGVVVLLTTQSEERAVRKMLTEAGVRPEQRDAVVGDPAIAAVTGARTPSGRPVSEPRAEAKSSRSPRVEHGARPERTRQSAFGGARRRPSAGAGAGAAARHPQQGERRPRRAHSN